MENFFYKTTIQNHDKIKKILLDQINLIPNNPINTPECKLFHTDWNLPIEMHREYKFLFFETVKEHLYGQTQHLGAPSFQITNFWFQQYTENGIHNWHTHPNANFSNVYFLECPEGSSTEFKNFKIECREGDILSFPAFLPHRSPEIHNQNRKTVIAFNTNITYSE